MQPGKERVFGGFERKSALGSTRAVLATLSLIPGTRQSEADQTLGAINSRAWRSCPRSGKGGGGRHCSEKHRPGPQPLEELSR